jgi:hypothetical protein
MPNPQTAAQLVDLTSEDAEDDKTQRANAIPALSTWGFIERASLIPNGNVLYLVVATPQDFTRAASLLTWQTTKTFRAYKRLFNPCLKLRQTRLAKIETGRTATTTSSTTSIAQVIRPTILDQPGVGRADQLANACAKLALGTGASFRFVEHPSLGEFIEDIRTISINNQKYVSKARSAQVSFAKTHQGEYQGKPRKLTLQCKVYENDD